MSILIQKLKRWGLSEGHVFKQKQLWCLFTSLFPNKRYTIRYKHKYQVSVYHINNTTATLALDPLQNKQIKEIIRGDIRHPIYK